MRAVLSRRWQIRLFAALAVVSLAFAPTLAQHALAHPLGNFTTNRYARIEVYQDRLQLHYVVDMAEIPAFQAMPEIDSDGDGAASEPELAAYARRRAGELPRNFELTAAGKRLSHALLQSTAQLLPGQGGLQVLRLVAVYDVPITGVESGSNVPIAFTDTNFGETQGWKEVVVRGSAGATLSGAEAFAADQSNALLDYPAESLRSAPNVSEASFSWVAGTGSPAPLAANVQLAEAGRVSGGFAAVFEDLSDGNVSFGFLLLSLLIAFAFGAQHALGPGHGKSMVAAYLVGSRGTPKHAVALGLTVTATHTSTVYLLGVVTLLASAWLTPEKVYLWMGVAAGLMVVAFGLGLFVQRLLQYRREGRTQGMHRHGLLGKAHSHPATHHPDGHDHAHSSGHAHDHDSRVTWRSLLSLGVLGGLLPCPSAVVVMVAAISQGQVLLGMLLIVAFSLGLAGVLMAIGVGLVLGRRTPGRARRLFERPLAARAVAVMPVLSAVVVTVVGLGLTYQAAGRV